MIPVCFKFIIVGKCQECIFTVAGTFSAPWRKNVHNRSGQMYRDANADVETTATTVYFGHG